MITETGKDPPLAQAAYKPYPKYKNTKLPWYGHIPNGWRVQKLKFGSHIKGRIGWQNLRAEEFTDKGPFLITGMHFLKGGVDWEACYHITRERYAQAPEIQIQLGDVLITKDGSIGKTAFIDYLPGPTSLNSHLLVIRDLESNYEGRFLFHLFSSDAFRAYILDEQKGTTFNGITQRSIENFPLLLPSIQEQRAIAEFLDRKTAEIDELIAKKKQLLELLQEKRAAMITQAVTKGLDPTVPMKESGVEWLGKIPVHWETKKVKMLSELQTGLTLGKQYGPVKLEKRPYLRVANVQAGYLDLDDIAEIKLPKQDVKRYELRQGDVVVTEGGDFDKLGRGHVWEGQIPGCLHQNHIFAVRCWPEVLNPQFLAAVTTSEYGRAYFTATSKQSTNLASTNSTKLRSFVVPLPTRQEQNAIAEYLEWATNEIDTLVKKVHDGIESLNEYRTALISAVVTGKIDVREQVPQPDKSYQGGKRWSTRD